MDRPDNDVSVVAAPVSGVDVIEPAGIGEAVVVEEGGSGVDAVGTHGPMGVGSTLREGLHEAEGVVLVLGQQGGGEGG